MGFSPFGGFDFMFSFIPVLVVFVFAAVLGVIIVTAIKGGVRWNKNNNSPVLSVYAMIVSKRMEIHHHRHHHNDNMAMDHTSSSTNYYVTFQMESGDRMELHVANTEYGLLVEGDMGKLTFQGTRYKGFERIIER